MPLPLTLALPLLVVAGVAGAAEPTFPPGSRIGLVPPEGMTPAPGMTGFRDARTGAGIVVIEMAAEAYPSIAAGFTDQALGAQGLKVKRRETTTLASGPGLLITGEQTDGARTATKTVLIASDPTMTALAVAQLPPDAPASAVEAVERSLRTVAFRPPLTMAEQLASLPFEVKEAAGFRPVRALGGNSLLMTDGPSDVIKEAEQPMMIVAKSYAPAPPAEARDAFARAALISNTSLRETVFERSQGFRQGGADWHEIVAKAKDGASGTPVVVMQTIRFQPDGYMRMVGVTRADGRDLQLPRFRRIVDNVVLRD